MNRSLVFLLILLALSSCYTRRTPIPLSHTVQSEQLCIVTSTGYCISVNLNEYISYLRQRTATDTLNNWNVVLRPGGSLAVDSLYESREKDWAAYADIHYYIRQELNNGNATIVDLKNKKDIKRIKRVTRYFQSYVIIRGGIKSVYYYSGRKKIHGKKYGGKHS